MTHYDGDDELTGYEEHLRDEGTRADYVREAYGDPCPTHGTLRYGGDCPACLAQEEELGAPAPQQLADTLRACTGAVSVTVTDDDIPF